MNISIIKRNGDKESLDISKIQRQVRNCCQGIDGVSPSMIELRAKLQFHDNMTTETIDQLLLQAMVGLIDESEDTEVNNVNYQYVAGRQRNSMLRKEVYGEYAPSKLWDIVKKNVEHGMYTPDLLDWYTEEEWNIIDLFLDHSKDEKYTYAAIAQLCEKYLVQNRSTGKIYETPQVRYAIAAATAFHAEPKDKRLKYVKEYYECASEGHFTLATPVLAGLGTNTKQFSSCFPAGQRVWTVDGEKNIESINVGDLVLTHEGSYQPVIATRAQSAPQEYLVKINNVYSLNGEFESTEDHLIMALKKSHPLSFNKKKYSVPQWTRADNIEKGDFVQIPYSKYIDPREKIKISVEFPQILDYLQVDDDGFLRKPTVDHSKRSGEYDDKVLKCSDEVILNSDLFRLLGYYAAEGHANTDFSVGFTLSSKETMFLEDIEQIIKSNFDLPISKHIRADNSTSITVHSAAFKTLLVGLVGNGFNTKTLHDIVMKATRENQENFLIGVIRGDGCVTKNGLSLGMSNRHLIRQISQIMIRCDLSPVLGVVTAEKINEYKNNRIKSKDRFEKTIITRHDSYKITLGLSGNLDFLRKVDKNSRLEGISKKRNKNPYVKVVDGMYFAKVREVSKRKANGIMVYDLQVNNVQSFTVNGVGVHNCVLISADDTLDSIFASGEMMAKYASKRAGIGLEIGRIRPLGAPIRNGEIKHTGLIPFLKKWYGDLRSCSQGGIRNASCTVYLPIWHYQFEDFIVLKNNQGTEETRVRQLDYGVVVSKLFWRRYKNGENITLFDPHEVPDLYEAYYRNVERFEELYVKYESDSTKKKKVLSAEEIFKNGILKERTDTGRIYLVNIDNVINQGPFDTEEDPIYMSNLCCLTGDSQLEFLHSNGQVEKMSLESAVERWELGALTDSKVKSYDQDSVIWKSVTAAAKTKTVTELYEVEDEQGNIIRCTGDHLIFTKNRGYVRADELVETDMLCSEV